MPRDPARAVQYARQAGDQALAARAPDQALRWFAEARRLLDEHRDAEPRERVAVLVGLGTAQRRTGNATSRPTLLDAAHRAAELGDRDLLVAAALANNRGFAVPLSTVDTERVAVLETALDAIGDDDSPARARLLSALASELEFGDAPRRRALTDEALAVARRVDDPATLVEILTARCGAIWHPDTVDAAAAAAAEARAIAERIGDPGGVFWATTRQGTAAIERGDLALLTPASPRRPDWPPRSAIRCSGGWPGGRWRSDGCSPATSTEPKKRPPWPSRLGNEAEQPDALIVFVAQSAAVLVHRGRFDDLATALRGLRAQTTSTGDDGIQASLARTLIELDQRAEALAFVDEAGADRFETRHDSQWLARTFMWADTVGRLGATEWAPLLRERLVPFGDQVIFTGTAVIGPVAIALGLLDTATGDYPQAEAWFRQAVALARRIEGPYWVAEASIDWAAMRLARGAPDDPDQARESLEAARAIAHTHGYEALQRRAGALLEQARHLS